jgi:hypothetical protein
MTKRHASPKEGERERKTLPLFGGQFKKQGDFYEVR